MAAGPSLKSISLNLFSSLDRCRESGGSLIKFFSEHLTDTDTPELTQVVRFLVAIIKSAESFQVNTQLESVAAIETIYDNLMKTFVLIVDVLAIYLQADYDKILPSLDYPFEMPY
jgi:hypothetical protein